MWNSFTVSNWTTRVPDGPLLSSNIFNVTETDYSELTKWKLNYSVFGFKENIFNGKEKQNKKHVNIEVKSPKTTKTPERGTRRRPTYAAKLFDTISKEADADESTDTQDDDDQQESANVLRQNKILEYRKLLTKTVKLKSAIFHERVRITCSKDGQSLEWYKSKTEDDDGSNKKQPIGKLQINKITNVKAKVDNLKYLEIYSGNTTYLFMFKTHEERDEWHKEFENFLKFMKLIEK